jgi:ATP-dependent Clp protease ATP-binding subunit ClpA
MRRTIERRVENELARRLLAGEFEANDSVRVDVDDEGGFTFSKVAAPEPAAVA